MARLYVQGLLKGHSRVEHVWLWLHTPQYCLNLPEYALRPLNMLERRWKSLNVPEYVGKCQNKLFWLFWGSQYAAIYL